MSSPAPAAPNEPPAEQAAKPSHVLETPEQVLATLHKDGTRRWIRPRPSAGRFLTGRRLVAYGLMVIFLALPHVTIGGKPAILIDLLKRQFTILGTTFAPTDTHLLFLLVLGGLLGVFLLTALFGRVWCGWACPQTVYMEFLFRPLDRLFEGSYQQQAKLDRQGGGVRRLAKNVVIVLISAFLAHTFLAYFVGWSQLMTYVTSAPTEHPTAFLVVIGVSLAMAFDFGWFREQTCLVACPYGRFQSVLLDRASLIVGYDRVRGEPRGKLKKKKKKARPLPTAVAVVAEPTEPAPAGDCIDCKACVTTCPTGIDIRDGLQLECIGCAQCIDACDAIMERVGKPTGLVRYGARSELEEGQPSRTLRPRVVIYTVAMLLVLGALGFSLVGRQSATVKALRGIGRPYATLPSGEVSNQLRIKVHNHSDQVRSYTIRLVTPSGAELVIPENPIAIPPRELRESNLFVVLPAASFAEAGEVPCALEISDGVDFTQTVKVTLLGPK